MARTEEQSRSLFDDWAAGYDNDLLHASGPLAGYDDSLRAFEAAWPVEPGMTVLDIGIGSGALAGRLAAQGARITGIDPSPRMLERCREKYPDFDLHEGTFNNIPADDAAFDGVVAGFAFHETPPSQRGAACAEIARVLKPGGHLCLLDIMFASQLAMAEAQQAIADMWDDEEEYAIVGELDTLLREHGFTAIRWVQAAPFHWMVIARRV